MSKQPDNIERKLLQDLPLTPEEARQLMESAGLQEYKHTLDAVHSLVDNTAEPPALLDKAILDHARKVAPAPRRTRKPLRMHNWQVWHVAAGVMAACLAVVMAVMIYTAMTEGPTNGDDSQNIAKLNPTENPDGLTPMSGTNTTTTAMPRLPVTAGLDWDGSELDSALMSLEVQVSFDLQTEDWVDGYHDLLNEI